ncbi:HNH endonuclease [Richelia sinica FACHB-800]|nr:HNH endonuclease [Richelia sinica FACHB-800]
MAKWVEDIVIALKNLKGVAPLADIYQEVRKVRPSPHPESLTAIVRGTIEDHSSDSARYKGKDLFFSVKGIGSGVWGLRSFVTDTPKASDIEERSDNENEVADNQNNHLSGNQPPGRMLQKTYRILRDTQLACQIKLLHHHRCQLCDTSIVLPNGNSYSEAHHIKPLGRPHNGPDIASNIIVLCPNHHVMLDYGVIKLDSNSIRMNTGHNISQEFIDYHNERVFGVSY